jgi:hypothetical protein
VWREGGREGCDDGVDDADADASAVAKVSGWCDVVWCEVCVCVVYMVQCETVRLTCYVVDDVGVMCCSCIKK